MSINAIKGSEPSLPPISKRELDSLNSNSKQGVKSINTQDTLNKTTELNPRNAAANESTVGKQIKSEKLSPIASKELTSVVSDLNNTMKSFNNKIKFDIDNRTNQVVVKIIDQESNEVIRQIPPKEILNIAARLEELSGILFHKEA